jgi:hypothetical protein
MKTKGLALLAVLLACSCASEGYNTQKGAAIGAIGGALAGQAIGHNTAGTLIGAASGALVGAVRKCRRSKCRPEKSGGPANPGNAAGGFGNIRGGPAGQMDGSPGTVGRRKVGPPT